MSDHGTHCCKAKYMTTVCTPACLSLFLCLVALQWIHQSGFTSEEGLELLTAIKSPVPLDQHTDVITDAAAHANANANGNGYQKATAHTPRAAELAQQQHHHHAANASASSPRSAGAAMLHERKPSKHLAELGIEVICLNHVSMHASTRVATRKLHMSPPQARNWIRSEGSHNEAPKRIPALPVCRRAE